MESGGILPEGINVIADSGYELNGFNISAKIEKVTTGKNHTFVLTDDGKVYATGSNNFGQLGTGDDLNYS